MRRARALGLLVGLVLLLSCKIEDHTPAGSRRDDAAIRALLTGYYRCVSERALMACRNRFWPGAVMGTLTVSGPASGRVGALPVDTVFQRTSVWLQTVGPGQFSVEMTRLDLRQAGDLASAWVFLRVQVPGVGGEARVQDGVEQLVLRRIGSEWRIAYGATELLLGQESANP